MGFSESGPSSSVEDVLVCGNRNGQIGQAAGTCQSQHLDRQKRVESVKVSYKNTKTQKIFASPSSLEKKHGKLAKKILLRLDTIKRAPRLEDVPKVAPDLCHQLTGDRDEQFAVWVDRQYRLVFEVEHDQIPRMSDGGIDLEAVTAVVIMEVVDYHRGRRKR